ncbi:MAG: hypothetical protein Q3X16_07440, partial [Alistipes sp.]|uniref:hypothetical protein n=1 Tax=Alistipes sp. TaxID=1872444 RepID=UPI002847A3E9
YLARSGARQDGSLVASRPEFRPNYLQFKFSTLTSAATGPSTPVENYRSFNEQKYDLFPV